MIIERVLVESSLFALSELRMSRDMNLIVMFWMRLLLQNEAAQSPHAKIIYSEGGPADYLRAINMYHGKITFHRDT